MSNDNKPVLSAVEPLWKLDDAAALAAENPYTFYKPSDVVISQLEEGDLVKLCFRKNTEDAAQFGAERMWVKILEVHPDGRFTGELANDPAVVQGISYQDRLTFSANHIFVTDRDDPVPSITEKYRYMCLVSKRILDGTEKIGVLRRARPQMEQDSGWRIMVGDETMQDFANPDRVTVVSLGAVLRRDDSFLPLLDSVTGASFKRNPETGEFESLETPQMKYSRLKLH